MLTLAALGLGLIQTRSGGQPKPGRRVGLPALHRDHAIIDVELEMVDEPMAHLAQRQPVPHRHRPGADEALPAGPQRQPLDRAAGGIGPVEHPDRLAVRRRRLEHVEQGGDEGVDAAADVLQIDQDHVERAHRLARRPPHLAIEAEHRHAVGRIGDNPAIPSYCPGGRRARHAAARTRPMTFEPRRDQRVERCGSGPPSPRRDGRAGRRACPRAARAGRGRRAGGRCRISCAGCCREFERKAIADDGNRARPGGCASAQ